MVDLDTAIFRARALAQSHPFSPVAYRYFREQVARERDAHSVTEIGVWAGHAMTAGYCVRRIEEDAAGRTLDEAPTELPADLDEATIHIATLIRTDGAEPYLLQPEEQVVGVLDEMIAGEVQRRLYDYWDGPLDPEVESDLIEYLSWWVIKGYALRVAERLVPEPAGQAK